MSARPAGYALTTRLAALFALLSFALLAALGVFLYRELERQLSLRDDAALLARVEQIRTLLQDENTLQLIRAKPGLFANMLGNREALLVLRFAGQAPLIEVNPGAMAIPELTPLPPQAPLTLAAVRHTLDRHGVPFIALAASTRSDDPLRPLQIIAGRAMGERTHMLAQYRQRILLSAGAGALLAALAALALVRRGLRPLRELARQTDGIGMANLAGRLDGAGAPRELAQLVAACNAMLERLANGFTRLSQVSADMAHDLRTPIANLLGQGEVALGQRRSVDYYEALLASNQEELQRLARMTENMLFLARAEHADSAIACASLPLRDELLRQADYFEGLAEERGLRIAVAIGGAAVAADDGLDDAHGSNSDGDDGNDGANGDDSNDRHERHRRHDAAADVEPAAVWADATLLRRALANLLANAVRHADAGSTITLSANADAAGVRLTVESHGATIAPEHLARLFDRFYRADAARHDSAGSSGLGLSIVRTVMALHHGRCEATSAAGLSRFSLIFPPRAG